MNHPVPSQNTHSLLSAKSFRRRWKMSPRIAAHCGQRETAFLGNGIDLCQKGFHLPSASRVNPPKGWLPYSLMVWSMTRQRLVWFACRNLTDNSLPHSLEIKHNPSWGNLIFWGWADYVSGLQFKWIEVRDTKLTPSHWKVSVKGWSPVLFNQLKKQGLCDLSLWIWVIRETKTT